MSIDVNKIHDVNISDLAAASSITSTDIVAVSQSAKSQKKATLAQITALIQTVANGALPAYKKDGTAAVSTLHIVADSVTAAGASTTVTFTALSNAVFANGNYFVFIQDNAAVGTLIVPTSQAAGNFVFSSTNAHVYSYIAIGA